MFDDDEPPGIIPENEGIDAALKTSVYPAKFACVGCEVEPGKTDRGDC